MSELRVVLLGNSCRDKEEVKRVLFKKTEGDPGKRSEVQSYSEQINNKVITVINTPDSLLTKGPDPKLLEDIRILSAPCHVFLLVLKPKSFSDKQKQRLESVLERLSDQALERSLVLISTDDGSMEESTSNPHIRAIVKKCNDRYLTMKRGDHQKLEHFKHDELLVQINQITCEYHLIFI